MKAVLVVANYSWFGKRPWRGITIAVPVLTAVLKGKFELALIDANVNEYSEEDVRQKFRENKDAGAVLITALSTEYYKAYHTVARLAKEIMPDVPVVMGGVYPTVCPEHVIEDENVDIAMMGHAEERLDALLKLIEEKNYEAIKCFEGIAYRSECGGGGDYSFNPVYC